MRKYLPAILVTAGLLLAARPTAAWGLQFDKAEYAARRQKLMEKIPDGAAILLGAIRPRASSSSSRTTTSFTSAASRSPTPF